MSGANLSTRLKRLKKLKNWHGLVPLAVFLVLALPTGLYFAFNVPAMWAADGGAHVARVFQISEGGLKPVYINHEQGIGYGGSIPVNVNELKTTELNIVVRDGAPGAEQQAKLITKQDKQQIAQISSQKISKQLQLISYVNSASYSPVAYAPNVFGVVVGKVLNLNIRHTLLLAGLCGLFTYLLCAGYALFTLRKSQLKWAVFVVALLPLAVFQTSVITADSFLMSVSILFSALLLKGLIGQPKLNTLDKTLLFLTVVAFPLTKSVYFPLVFLILLIPKDQWSEKSRYWLWAGAALVLSMIGFGVWSKITADVAASNGLVRGDALWKYGDAKIQEKFILTHPFGFLHAIFDSFLYQSKFYMNTYFGWLGFTYQQIPGLAEIAGFLALGLSVLLAGGHKVRRLTYGYIALAVAAVTVIVFAVFYVAFTLPKFGLVQGLQGRYFVPMTILIVATVAGLLPKLRIAVTGQTSAKLTLIFLSSFCLLFSTLHYALAITT